MLSVVKFAVKFGLVLLPIRIVLGTIGWFAGEHIQGTLPDDGIDVYPSLEAAQQAMYRGHDIVDQYENWAFIAIGTVLFLLMWRRHKAAADGGTDLKVRAEQQRPAT